MIKKISFVVVIGFFLAFAPSAKAQQPPKIWKIGVLVSTSRSLDDYRDESLSRGLYNLGYVEGKNIIMEYRYADGQLDRLPQLAAELVKLKVDVIIVYGTRVAVAAKQATSTIPIVIAGAGDPVQAGLVNSFSHPGTNVTGVSRLSTDFIGNRVELIIEDVPKAVRIAALSNPDNPAEAPSLKEIGTEARALAMRLQTVTARTPAEFETAFGAATKGGA